MVEKLRSIIKRTPWSLVIKAFLAGVVWLWVPSWFAIFAIVLYFVPLFRPGEVLVPFVMTLAFAELADPQIWSAFIVLVLMFLILGIKDLILIRRVEAYQMLGSMLLLAIGLEFFPRAPTFEYPILLFIPAALFYMTARSVLSYTFRDLDHGIQELRRRSAGLAVATLLIAEWTGALMFLPLTAFEQAALFLLAAAILLELILDYGKGILNRTILLAGGSALLVGMVLILTAVEWGI